MGVTLNHTPKKADNEPKLTKVDWTNNNHEGRGLRRGFAKLEERLETVQDIHELTEVVRAMGYIAQIKAGIAKNQEMEKRIVELERLAGIAQSGVIAK